MVAAGILTIMFYVLVPISLGIGFVVGAANDNEDPFFVSFFVAWVFGVLGSISLVAFAIMAVMQALS